VFGGKRHDVTDTAKVKGVVRERLDDADSARGNGSLGRDVLLQTVQGESYIWERRDVTESVSGKGVVMERRDVTDSAKGKESLMRDVMLQTVQEGKGSFD